MDSRNIVNVWVGGSKAVFIRMSVKSSGKKSPISIRKDKRIVEIFLERP